MSQPHVLLPLPLRSARTQQAGFTLVELMVAMTGGLFLSIVVFALSRDAARFYQSETRAANATLAGVTGFERLFSDLSRAGHLATPNITSDPRVCNRPVAGWPDRIFSLRAVRFAATSTDLSSTELSTTGMTPMAIEIAGALDRSEELLTNHVGPAAGGGFAVTIREDSPAAARLGIRVGSTANKAILEAEFLLPGGVGGRAVRIAQVDGMEQYGLVSSIDDNPTLRIILDPNPALVFRSNAGVQCGLRGFNTGASINAIQFVRYELRSMVASTTYASLFNASSNGGGSGNVPFEAGRVELIREELNPVDGEPMPGSIEIISEYATDLQFSALRATNPTTPALIAAAPAAVNATYNATQLLRAINVRLSVRSREVDRFAAVTLPDPDAYRVCMAACGTPQEQYARVRTFQAEVPLRNMENVNW